jgi:hypothetical protein
MRKTTLTIILIILVALAVFCFYPLSLSDPEFTTASPNGTYRVHMRDRTLENFNHIVRLDVAKNGKPLIENEIFYSDSNAYFYNEPEHAWVSVNVLRFGQLNISTPPDEVTVVNQASKTVSYLKVSALDDFLLLEVQPNSATLLFTSPQTNRTTPASCVGGYVKYGDGKDTLQWGRCFKIQDKYISPAHYCVILKDEGVVVLSREFGEHETDESREVVGASGISSTLCK